MKITDDLASGTAVECLELFGSTYNDFISSGVKENAVFALHHEIMEHCDEVVALALSERLEGADGYTSLLGVVKKFLSFAFVNGSSSYAKFDTQLLHEHYKAGPFCKAMKQALYTGRHKKSDINFGLDTQREMEHKDVTKAFKSGGTLSSVIPKMSSIDFLEELETLVSLDSTEESPKESKRENHCDILGLGVTSNDLAYV